MTIKVKHVWYLALATFIIWLNNYAYNMEIISKGESNWDIVFFIEACMFLGFLIFSIADIIAEWDEKYSPIFNKPLITIAKKPKADNLNLVDLAETPEELELLKSIEKRLNNK